MGVTPSALLDEEPDMLATLLDVINFNAEEAKRAQKR